jgi:hypothetical protein
VENGTVEPCVYCGKPDCRVLVILSTYITGAKRFEQEMDPMGLTCPACDRILFCFDPQYRVEGTLRSGLPKRLFVERLELSRVNCRSTSQAQGTSPGQ